MALSKRNKMALCGLLGVIMIFGIVLIFTPSSPVQYGVLVINDTNTDLQVQKDQNGNTVITLKPENTP